MILMPFDGGPLQLAIPMSARMQASDTRRDLNLYMGFKLMISPHDKEYGAKND